VKSVLSEIEAATTTQSSRRARLRIYLRGAAAALAERLAQDPNLEIVDRVDEAEAVLSLPPASDDHDPPIEALTSREHDVLSLLADGLVNRDIASRLEISEHTVKFHLASIFGKLGVSTRTEAVQRGLRLGVIEI
jgi:ATP/maltotriose-dependent transcriptional regulator MalT